MKISLFDLRKLIREEVDRLVRRSAGFMGGLGLSNKPQDHSEITPKGLGDEDIHDEEEQQEKISAGRRVGRR